jgi:hypothetical protein
MFGDKPEVDGILIEAIRADALDVAGQGVREAQLNFERQVAAAADALFGPGEHELSSSSAGEVELSADKA